MKINPMYILILSFIIAIITFLQLNTTKNEFEQQTKNLYQIKILAKTFKQIEINTKDKIIKHITNILNNPIFKSLRIIKSNDNDTLILKMQGESSLLDKCLNKILNNNFEIKSLQLKDKFIELEISLS